MEENDKATCLISDARCRAAGLMDLLKSGRAHGGPWLVRRSCLHAGEPPCDTRCTSRPSKSEFIGWAKLYKGVQNFRNRKTVIKAIGDKKAWLATP